MAGPDRIRSTRAQKSPEKPRAQGARQAVKSPPSRTAALKHQDRSNDRYDDIVRAAAEIFYRKGYDATTMQDIAEVVGMLKGSLYYYISAKEDLLYEIIDEVHEVWAKNLERNTVMQGDPLTRIWAFVHDNVIGNAMNLVNSAVFSR